MAAPLGLRPQPPAPPPEITRALREARADLPLRAQSVSLSERPRSKYSRNVQSADSRSRNPNKQFIHGKLPEQPKPRQRKYKKVEVKKQNRKVVEKIPCSISVQTLSLPMKYADTKHSTSRAASFDRIDYKTKFSNPPKQVSDNKRLCSTIGCGKETENKLLLQICEAQQVSDFERILNSNAILCESGSRHVWRGCAAPASSASVLSRPRSAYSLRAVNDVYHNLFHQHELSLQPLIQQYRQAAKDDHKNCPPVSILQKDWFENLQDLSEFYEDDESLHEEIETITDKIVEEQVKAITEANLTVVKNKNFNVNLTDLIGLHVSGEGFSSISPQDGPSPDVDRAKQDEDKEWLGSSMSSNSEFEPITKETSDPVDCLTQDLNSVKIDHDAKVPTITFSACCDGCARSELPNNKEVVIHLTVPSIENADESRPPM